MKETVYLSPEYRALFAEKGSMSFNEFFDLQTDSITSQKGSRTVSMFTTNCADKTCVFFIKTHSITVPWCFRTTSPAFKEAAAIHRLNAMGIRTPSIAACGTNRTGRLLTDFIITEKINNAVSLEDYLAEGKDPHSVLRSLASFVARIHALGVIHRDMYTGHIFVNTEKKETVFHLIDLERVFFTKNVRRRWRVKDLASLWFSTPSGTVSDAVKLRFFVWYCRCAGLKKNIRRRLLRRIINKHARIARHTDKVIGRGGWT